MAAFTTRHDRTCAVVGSAHALLLELARRPLPAAAPRAAGSGVPAGQ